MWNDFLKNDRYAFGSKNEDTTNIDNHGEILIAKIGTDTKNDIIITNTSSLKSFHLNTGSILSAEKYEIIAAETTPKNDKNIAIFSHNKSGKIKSVLFNHQWEAKKKERLNSAKLKELSQLFEATVKKDDFIEEGIDENGNSDLPLISDAAGDGTPYSLFDKGALRIQTKGLHNAKSLEIEAVNKDLETTINLTETGPIEINPEKKDIYVNLRHHNFTLEENRRKWKFKVTADNGTTINEKLTFHKLHYLTDESTGKKKGNIMSNILTWDKTNESSNKKYIVLGRGGTDLLNIKIKESDSASYFLNGTNLNDSTDTNHTKATELSTFMGTSFDVLTIKIAGEKEKIYEFYMQGIEQIHMPNQPITQVLLTNQTNLQQGEWNLQAMDVPNAWRFGKGSENTILVSLDAGLKLPVDEEISHVVQKTENIKEIKEHHRGHQEQSIAVMAGKTVGIAPKSTLWAYNVYDTGNLTLTESIQSAINQASDKNLIFQTGIQGEKWWWSRVKEGDGDQEKAREFTQKVLDETTNAGNSFFAIAAGNCIENPFNPSDKDKEKIECKKSVSGLAKAAVTNANIASIGAMRIGSLDTIIGPSNVGIASPPMNEKSNTGDNLTLAAPTLTLAILNQEFRTFRGTSNANPNAAGVAALVWDQFPKLNGSELREILIHSAEHFGPEETKGFSLDSGHGMINADAAVRRTNALANNEELARFWQSDEFLV